jgi:hypothetical protein
MMAESMYPPGLQELLAQGANPNGFRDMHGRYALMLSSESDDSNALACVNTLLIGGV